VRKVFSKAKRKEISENWIEEKSNFDSKNATTNSAEQFDFSTIVNNKVHFYFNIIITFIIYLFID
jgi:hypothetical protein